MKYLEKFATACGVLALGIALTGCGSEPSESDIQAAITKEQAATPEIMKGMVPEVSGVKKVGCKADGEKAYICDVELEAKQFGKTNKGVAQFRLVKGSDGWAITKR
ncbi:MAG: hypothetical protein K2X55_18520 [Burkholderiaceae bacterium]|nr:hypothetical protein [Burkholderiaceae bacterium]